MTSWPPPLAGAGLFLGGASPSRDSGSSLMVAFSVLRQEARIEEQCQGLRNASGIAGVEDADLPVEK